MRKQVIMVLLVQSGSRSICRFVRRGSQMRSYFPTRSSQYGLVRLMTSCISSGHFVLYPFQGFTSVGWIARRLVIPYERFHR